MVAVTGRFLYLAEALTIARRPDGVPSIVKDDALRVLADKVTQLQAALIERRRAQGPGLYGG